MGPRNHIPPSIECMMWYYANTLVRAYWHQQLFVIARTHSYSGSPLAFDSITHMAPSYLLLWTSWPLSKIAVWQQFASEALLVKRANPLHTWTHIDMKTNQTVLVETQKPHLAQFSPRCYHRLVKSTNSLVQSRGLKNYRTIEKPTAILGCLTAVFI